MAQNIINWFEIPVTDFERAKQFYSDIFGFEIAEQNMAPFRMGFLASVDQGGVSGAIVQGEGYNPTTEGMVIYFNGGADLNNVLTKVEPAGGQVILQKTLITPEHGYFAFFLDTEGNKVGIHSQG